MGPNGEFRKYMKAIGGAFDDIPGTGMVTNHPPHLEDDALIAFHQNRLSAAARESAGLHLKQCGVCAAKFEDVRDFLEPLYIGEKDWSKFEQRKAWRKLRAQLPFEVRRPDQPTASVGQGFFFNSQAMLALAAGLLLTTSLTGTVAVHLYQKNRDLQMLLEQNHNEMVAKISPHERSANGKVVILAAPNAHDPALPQINTLIREITVYDTVRSTKNGKDTLVTTLPAKADYFAFTLDLVRDSFPTYRVEFADLNGKSILNQPNLRPNERGNEKSSEPRPDQRVTLSVSIPRHSLKPGQYLFRIYGQSGTQPILLEALTWSFN